MNTVANIAFRNLSRQKKRSFLLGGAIAFGVLIVTLINGFAGAFVANVSDNFSYLLAGHVFVQGFEKTASGKDVSVIRDDSAIMKAIKDADIPSKYISRSSSFSGTLIFEGRKASTTVAGIDLVDNPLLRDRLVLKEGTWEDMKDPRSIILTDKLAARLKAQPGDRILVQLQTSTGQNNAGEFTLRGVSLDAGILGQMMMYANIGYVSELMGLAPGEYDTVGIMLGRLKDTEPAAQAVYAGLKAGVQVFDRGKKSEDGATTPFMAAMRQQKKETWTGVKYRLYTIDDILSQIKDIVNALDVASTVILVVLFLIIMVGITNSFRMVMYERIREIGTMRALGIQRGGVRSMFLYEAVFLAIGGALAGILLALAAMGVISMFNLGMDSPLFILLKNGHLSFFVPPLRALFNILLITALTFVAASRPAGQAAKLEPAVALRTAK